MERFVTVAQKAGDSLELAQQGKLAGRVVPLARVVAIDSGRQRGERLDLQLDCHQRADRQSIAGAQRAH